MFLAKAHPTSYDELVGDEFNGKQKPVDFADIGCGYGGLTGNKTPRKWLIDVSSRPCRTIP